ncbi:cobyric acid synthase CobQ [Metallosphaera yellowstonensis MK1]|jgi:adenosylcobyric acid synthase|uniref:Probable cobyric acid synthase n=1 Tax=Metallosphaera yellowstonensis MK1 TaxID=671065 RepID=H2C670_9CREN|nr:cobyric acid synthase [Metallosphaera yellowstonensis]EHP69297.1 cobyric acid synthase CobQ [Metallosphaera yellowstonensis MK1]
MAIIISSSMSDSGKSIVTAALVKLLGGVPFKAQNMSLNSFPSHDGGEMAFIQAFQAMGSEIRPERWMNPVLLKPSGNGIEVIFMGESLGNMDSREYYSTVERLWPKVKERITEDMVIEAAGGLGEPNFLERDISGYKLMELGVPSIMVLDIDRGGAFASAFGIYNMFPTSLRPLLRGFIINKFRGDEKFLEPAVRWLEQRTGMKFLGTIPYDDRISNIAEDSMNVRDLGEGEMEVDVIAVPYMSNFNEFQAFQKSNAHVRFVRRPSQLSKADLVILPGTRNTKAALSWLVESGFVGILKNKRVLGICGGFQIMGRRLIDPYGLEAGVPSDYQGLGILPIEVKFRKTKVVANSKAVSDLGTFEGYEIRRGEIIYSEGRPLLTITERNGNLVSVPDGAEDGDFFGLSLHGSLYSQGGRKLLEEIGLKFYGKSLEEEVREQVNLIAEIVRSKIDTETIWNIYTESRIRE